MKFPLVLSVVGYLSSSAVVADAASQSQPLPSRLGKGVPIGKEVEELVDHVVAMDETSGQILFKKTFDKKIPRAHAITRSQAALAEMFDLVTHQDLEELNSEIYQLRVTGVPSWKQLGSEERGLGIWKAAKQFGLFKLGTIGAILGVASTAAAAN